MTHEIGQGPESSSLISTLRERGYRLTPQRQLIVDILESATGHIAPEDVYQQVYRQFPCVNRSTVYRTLDLLEELGLVAHAHLGDGAARYHRTEEAGHLHLVCHECGTMIQIDDLDVAADFLAALRARHGFVGDLTHHAIAGQCRHCAEKNPDSNRQEE
jgi:Fur family transcriptional regulator, ferric uptake regulator